MNHLTHDILKINYIPQTIEEDVNDSQARYDKTNFVDEVRKEVNEKNYKVNELHDEGFMHRKDSGNDTDEDRKERESDVLVGLGLRMMLSFIERPSNI